MTKAQQVYERINALVESGMKKADAFRELANELGQPEKSLQGAYYQHSRKANGGGTRSRKREMSTDDALEQAITVLEAARDNIDAEIGNAKERADEAKAEHDALKSSASERKQAIQAKIDALKS